MPITNYEELKTSIRNFIDDASVDSLIPDFIALAEVVIKDDLRLLEMETTAISTLGIASKTIALPQNYIEMISMKYGSNPVYRPTYKTPHELIEYESTIAGKPGFYTVNDNQLEFNRLPDEPIDIEMKYFRLSPLSDQEPTNAVLTAAPNVYLFESIIQACTFVDMDDTKYAKMAASRDRAFSKANDSADEKRLGAGPMRMSN